MVFRMQLTHDEIMVILTINYFPPKITGYTLPPRISELNDINETLEFLSPDDVTVSITIDGVRLKSNLNINQTLIFTKKSFFTQY